MIIIPFAHASSSIHVLHRFKDFKCGADRRVRRPSPTSTTMVLAVCFEQHVVKRPPHRSIVEEEVFQDRFVSEFLEKRTVKVHEDGGNRFAQCGTRARRVRTAGTNIAV